MPSVATDPSRDGSPPQATAAFIPFYEQAVYRGGVLGEIAFSIAIGAAFFGVRWLAVRSAALTDWSLFLAALISTSAAMLYYATRVLRNLIPRLATRVDGQTTELGVVYEALSGGFTTRRFLVGGALFALLNLGCGMAFGVAETNGPWGEVTLYAGFALVGFICGMAVSAIRGVILGIAFVAKHLKADYSAPDGCGGLLFLGEALVKFASATLMVGVLISIYIVNAPWTRTNSAHPLVRLLEWVWIVWPFLLSLLVLADPLSTISVALDGYKLSREGELDVKLETLRERIGSPATLTADKDELLKEYEFYEQRRGQVYSMRVWPLRLGTRLSYVGVFVGHLGASVFNVILSLSKHPP